MRGGNREMRRMMDKMGLDMNVPVLAKCSRSNY